MRPEAIVYPSHVWWHAFYFQSMYVAWAMYEVVRKHGMGIVFLREGIHKIIDRSSHGIIRTGLGLSTCERKLAFLLVN